MDEGRKRDWRGGMSGRGRRIGIGGIAIESSTFWLTRAILPVNGGLMAGR